MRLTTFARNATILSVASAAFLTVACGGGGSDSDSDPFGRADDGGSESNPIGGDGYTGYGADGKQPRPTRTPTPNPEQLKAPVGFELHGMNEGKTGSSYTITPDKDVSHIRVNVRYKDANGKVVQSTYEGTGSSGKALIPANTSKLFTSKADVERNPVSVEAWVVEVEYTDGTKWERPS